MACARLIFRARVLFRQLRARERLCGRQSKPAGRSRVDGRRMTICYAHVLKETTSPFDVCVV